MTPPMTLRLLARHRAAVAALGAAGALTACTADAPTTAPATPALPTVDAPARTLDDAAHGGAAGFYWLTPTVVTQPATFSGTFDRAAIARLAVEVCALDAAATACDGAPVARYTATTTPYAQQLRADTVRQHVLVYWPTTAADPSRTYRARVLLDGAPIGAADVRVARTSAELSAVDRTRYAAALLGQPLALRFRVEQGAQAPAEPAGLSAAEVRAHAARLYAALAAGAPATVQVRALLDQVLTVLDTGTRPDVGAYLAQGTPTAYDFQAVLVARALTEEGRPTVANFAEAAAARGVVLRDASGARTAAPLTREALTALLQPLVGRERYARGELLPAFVLALAQERAARAQLAAPDPVWGDGTLDAVQTVLLQYAMEFATDSTAAELRAASTPVSASRAPASMTPAAGAPAALARSVGPRVAGVLPRLPGGGFIGKWAPKIGREVVVGWFGQKIGVPTTWPDGGKASVCASVLMYGHRFTMGATPTELGTIDVGRPVRSTVRATLRFEVDPNVVQSSILGELGCELPSVGPVYDKTVEWTVDGKLLEHGQLLKKDEKTDVAGLATADYGTYVEVVPPALRTLAREDNGVVKARAKGLVPQWSTLEKMVGVGVWNPTDAGVRLFVKYYAWPSRATLDFTVRLDAPFMTAGTWSVARRGTIELEKDERPNGAVVFLGDGEAYYTRFRITPGPNECDLAPLGTTDGGFGFNFVAADPTASVAPLTGMAMPGDPLGEERYSVTCGTMVQRGAVPGFTTILTALYEPLMANGLGWRTKNGLTGWTITEAGVLTKQVTRTVPTAIGPTTEQATYTLRFHP